MTVTKLESDEQQGSSRFLACQEGAAMVEFALVLPLLLLLLFGMMDFGRAFNYWINETQLASGGARWAAVNKNPDPGSGSLANAILAEADTKQLSEGGPNSAEEPPARVCISFPNGTEEVGDPVEVTVTYGFHWLPFLENELKFTTTSLTASATMRIELEPSEYREECSS